MQVNDEKKDVLNKYLKAGEVPEEKDEYSDP